MALSPMAWVAGRKPAAFLGLSLGLTFPFNILLGIPLYTWMAGTL